MKTRFTYLGVDAHPDACQLAVMTQEATVISCKSYPTSAPELIESVASIKGHKKMVIEESQMADWLKRTLEPYVDECIIADPKVNAWISKGQHMNDKIAAVRLTKLLIGGYIKPVYHGDPHRQQFKEIVLHYHDLTRQIARFKNKLKGEFIAKAIPVNGMAVYNSNTFPHYLKLLKNYPATQFEASNYFAMIKKLEEFKAKSLTKIRSFYKSHPEIKQLSLIPAIGQVSAFTISAIVDTPHRFSNKRKFWTYCCLSKSEKSSNGKIYKSKSYNQGNHLLKHVFVQAAKTIISSKQDSRFKQTAKRLLDQGVSMKNVRRTIARQLSSTVLKIWKTGEPYHDLTEN